MSDGAAGQDVFEALRVSLAGFRDQVEHLPRHRITAVSEQDGPIPDLVRHMLSTLADVLAWLARTLSSVADVRRAVTSAVALIQVSGAMLHRLASGLPFRGLPQGSGNDPDPFKAVADAITSGNAALNRGIRATQTLPRTEDLAGVRRELELLLGKRVNPALPGPGSLGALLSAIQRRGSA